MDFYAVAIMVFIAMINAELNTAWKDFCLIPIGTANTSVAEEVAECQRILAQTGLAYKVSFHPPICCSILVNGVQDAVHSIRSFVRSALTTDLFLISGYGANVGERRSRMRHDMFSLKIRRALVQGIASDPLDEQGLVS
jgi:hypothetical protein